MLVIFLTNSFFELMSFKVQRYPVCVYIKLNFAQNSMKFPFAVIKYFIKFYICIYISLTVSYVKTQHKVFPPILSRKADLSNFQKYPLKKSNVKSEIFFFFVKRFSRVQFKIPVSLHSTFLNKS